MRGYPENSPGKKFRVKRGYPENSPGKALEKNSE